MSSVHLPAVRRDFALTRIPPQDPAFRSRPFSPGLSVPAFQFWPVPAFSPIPVLAPVSVSGRAGNMQNVCEPFMNPPLDCNA